MTNENETGVKVPKGQINYNTVAGSLGLAAFAGLGLKNWFGGACCNNQVAGTAAFAESQFVSSLMSELAKEKSERYAELVAVAVRRWLTPIVKTIGGGIKIPVISGIGKFMGSVFGLDLSTYNLLNELDFIIEPTLDYIIKPQLAKLSKFIPDEQIPKVVNSYLDAAISKATAKGSVNLFGFEFEATAFQNLKREIDNSLKNNVSHDERPT